MLDVCVDYHCDERRVVTAKDELWRQVTELLGDARNAAAERRAIGRIIALLEQHLGKQAGTDGDLAFNRAGAGEEGQLDCIAESMNTDTYLRLLQEHQLLRWHRVEAREVRRRWIFMSHWTAVIRDMDDGALYAVDSWPRDNGYPPHIQPLSAWRVNEPLRTHASE